MQDILDFLEPIEAEVARIVEEVEAQGKLVATPRPMGGTLAAVSPAGEPLVGATENY
jgi:hypothetical protein